MIYPKKLNSKKVDLFLGILSISLIIVSIILLIINKLVTPNIWWSHICIISFLIGGTLMIFIIAMLVQKECLII